MQAVKISPKYQVVIPEDVRKKMALVPGETLQVIQYENRIEFIPVRKMSRMRGFLHGMDSRIHREADRL